MESFMQSRIILYSVSLSQNNHNNKLWVNSQSVEGNRSFIIMTQSLHLLQKQIPMTKHLTVGFQGGRLVISSWINCVRVRWCRLLTQSLPISVYSNVFYYMLFIYLLHVTAHVRTTCRVTSLLLPYGFGGLYSGHQPGSKCHNPLICLDTTLSFFNSPLIQS